MADDPFSKLPDDIRLRILELISFKDIVRSSGVSKSWLRSRRSFPSILHFSIYDFGFISSEQFIRFVHPSLNSDEQRIKSFSLVTADKETDDEVSGWICTALDKQLEDLTVKAIHDTRFHNRPCSIPSRVFSTDSIKSLSLIGSFAHPGINNNVYLPNLTVLSLEDFEISEEQLRQLLHGCPILKDLSFCYRNRIPDISISENPNLENLGFRFYRSKLSDDRVRVRVRVSAPKLKQVLFHCEEDSLFHNSSNLQVEFQGCPNVSSLDIKYTLMGDDLLHTFLTQFPLLETLTVHCGNRLNTIRISNPLLTSLHIHNPNQMLDEVVIDSKKLSFFKHSQYRLPKWPNALSVRMDNPSCVCVARISVRIDEGDPPYLQLKEFLDARQPMFRYLELDIVCRISYAFMGTTYEQLPCSACEIEELSLRASSFSSSVLNGVLSVCHPRTIKLEVNQKYLPSIKVICEEFANKQGNCWCKDDFKCWKHQLKNVKIGKIDDINIDKGDLNRDILDILLPTLRENKFIFFTLWW